MAGRVAWKDLVEAKGRDRKVEVRMARESIVMQASGGGVARLRYIYGLFFFRGAVVCSGGVLL